ncbi:MAG: LbtU family siderophore porin [Kiritimatiellae bacterium]|nr:LbtU family siderophore porin [Kiritimatiellia bacterium]
MKSTTTLIGTGAALCALSVAAFAEEAADAEEKAPALPLVSSIGNFTVEGLVEVSAAYTKQGSDKDTDVNVDTVELDLSLEPTDRLSLSVAFLYEEGEEDDHVIVDSAEIAYAFDSVEGLSLHVGKIYMPFGSFETGLISDPLTLELGEISDGAVGLVWESEYLDLAAYAFGGDINDANDDADKLQYVAAATLKPVEGFSLKFAVLSDICEAALDDDVIDALENPEDGEASYDGALGVNVAALIEAGDFTIAAEYLAAAEDVELNGGEFKPRTWAVDLAWAATDRLTLAARYEGSKEFNPEEMPEKQFGVGGEWAFDDNLSLALEYLYGEFDDVDGESQDDRHVVTAKVAFSF